MSSVGGDMNLADDSFSVCNLKVKCQDERDLYFRMKRTTKLKKLMHVYCYRHAVDFNSTAFLFDGRRLNGEQTPDELEMENGDEIIAMLPHAGVVDALSLMRL